MTLQVTIVQRVLTHYRVPFFEKLRVELAAEGIELQLVHGQEESRETSRNDQARIDWALRIRNRYIPVGRRRLCWQPVIRAVRGSDLVIVEQASRLLVNYPLLAWRLLGGPRVAFWGHGKNHDTRSASPLAEAVKRRLARHVDWWFCYTEGTARLIDALGVPQDRLTVVQNATDTTALRSWRASITAVETESLRRELGLGEGPVAVVLGSLYPSKRPSFVLASADHLADSMPGFQLIVIGDGPDRPALEEAARERPWLHVVGVRRGRELALYASPASVMLNPGVVGLGILDAFALGLPAVTCRLPGHGPEIEYLADGVNGLVLAENSSPAAYAEAVVSLCLDASRLDRLRAGCAVAAEQYTVDEMSRRSGRGIIDALHVQRRRCCGSRPDGHRVPAR